MYVNYLPSLQNCSNFIFTWKHSYHISITYDLTYPLVKILLCQFASFKCIYNFFTFPHSLSKNVLNIYYVMSGTVLCTHAFILHDFKPPEARNVLSLCFHLSPPSINVLIVMDSLSQETGYYLVNNLILQPRG